MRRFRWQLLIIFLTGLVVGILLLNEQPRPTSPLATPEPVRGGVYTEALVGNFQRLNPLMTYYNQADRDISRLIFGGLVRFDGRGAPQPDLAETWGISLDGTLYNVSLRQNLTWHDGKPLTADDILFTIDLMRNGGKVVPADVQEFWKSVETVRLSDTMVQFKLPEAFAPFLDYLSFGILPKHLLEGKTADQLVDDAFNLKPVGSGPYRFDRLLVEGGAIQGVVLAAFEKYYASKAYIDELVFRYYPDASAAMQAYLNGEVQGVSQVTADTLNAALSTPNLAVYTARRPQLTMVLLNLANPDVDFLQDKNVRRALLTAIYRQSIIDQQLQGQAILADGPILQGTWAYYDKTPRVEYDPEAARTLLKKAGFSLAAEGDTILSKKDKALQFTLAYPDTPTHRLIAERLQADWLTVGVQADLEAVPYDQLVTERLADRSYQAALVDLNLASSPDPDPYPFWDQAMISGGQNYSQWDNRMASEYLEQARMKISLADRAKDYRNFQVVFAEELPALPLFNGVYTYAVDRTIQGVRIGPMFDPSDRFANVVEWNLPGKPRTALQATTPSPQP